MISIDEVLVRYQVNMEGIPIICDKLLYQKISIRMPFIIIHLIVITILLLLLLLLLLLHLHV